MTQEKILRLAIREAENVWERYYERLERLPGNKIAAYKEQQAWVELMELKKMLQEITKG